MSELGSEPRPKKCRRSEKTKGLECFAVNCYSYRNRVSAEDGISFHKFPDKTKHTELYHRWRLNCGRDVEPSAASRLCSKHFEPRMINRTLDKPQIRENAVPTIFDYPEHLKPRRLEESTSETGVGDLEEESRDSQAQREPGEAQELVAKDHSYNLQEADLKGRLLRLRQQNEELRKHVRNARVREKRVKSAAQELLQHLMETGQDRFASGGT